MVMMGFIFIQTPFFGARLCLPVAHAAGDRQAADDASCQQTSTAVQKYLGALPTFIKRLAFSSLCPPMSSFSCMSGKSHFSTQHITNIMHHFCASWPCLSAVLCAPQSHAGVALPASPPRCWSPSTSLGANGPTSRQCASGHPRALPLLAGGPWCSR